MFCRVAVSGVRKAFKHAFLKICIELIIKRFQPKNIFSIFLLKITAIEPIFTCLKKNSYGCSFLVAIFCCNRTFYPCHRFTMDFSQ